MFEPCGMRYLKQQMPEKNSAARVGSIKLSRPRGFLKAEVENISTFSPSRIEDLINRASNYISPIPSYRLFFSWDPGFENSSLGT